MIRNYKLSINYDERGWYIVFPCLASEQISVQFVQFRKVVCSDKRQQEFTKHGGETNGTYWKNMKRYGSDKTANEQLH